MRLNSLSTLMISQAYASISKEVVRLSASPKRESSSEVTRLPVLPVYIGNTSDSLPLILDSEESRSNILVIPTTESVLTEVEALGEDESYFPSPYDMMELRLRIRNSWEGEPDLIVDDKNVLAQRYLNLEGEVLETYGTLAIGPGSAFADKFKSFILVPVSLGSGPDRRIVKHLVLNPVNPGCDCAGPDYRMKSATAIRVPGVGFTTADVWAVMGSTHLVDGQEFSSGLRGGSSSSLKSAEAIYRISTASNTDRIPAEIYDALVANITSQGASVSSMEQMDLSVLTTISNCERVVSWPKIVYSIQLADASSVFDIVIDESDYSEPIRSLSDDDSSTSCILHLQPARQIYSKPLTEYTIGVNSLNKVSIHFDNVRRQLGFCYSSLVRRV